MTIFSTFATKHDQLIEAINAARKICVVEWCIVMRGAAN
jgi:hypothetical protein